MRRRPAIGCATTSTRQDRSRPRRGTSPAGIAQQTGLAVTQFQQRRGLHPAPLHRPRAGRALAGTAWSAPRHQLGDGADPAWPGVGGVRRAAVWPSLRHPRDELAGRDLPEHFYWRSRLNMYRNGYPRLLQRFQDHGLPGLARPVDGEPAQPARGAKWPEGGHPSASATASSASVPRALFDRRPRAALEFDDVICRRMIEHGTALTFLQVGAFDGVSNDPLRKYIAAHRWNGVCVEPQPAYAEALRRLYRDAADRIVVVEAAVSAAAGEATMYALAGGALPNWAAQLASLDRATVLKHRNRLPAADIAIVEITTPTVTFDTLLSLLGGIARCAADRRRRKPTPSCCRCSRSIGCGRRSSISSPQHLQPRRQGGVPHAAGRLRLSRRRRRRSGHAGGAAGRRLTAVSRPARPRARRCRACPSAASPASPASP